MSTKDPAPFASAIYHSSADPFRLLVEAVVDYAIFMLDTAGRIVSWNPGATRIYGYQADEVLGRSFSVLYPNQDLEAANRELERVRERGRVEAECIRIRKDGSAFWAIVTTTPLQDPFGHHIGFAKVTRDITERHRALENLQHERDLSTSVLRSLPGVYYVYDEAGKFTRWNSEFERVTEYSADEIKTAHPLDFFAGEDKTRVAERIEEVFRTGQSSIEANFVSKSGRKTPYFFTGVRAEIEGKASLLGMGIDISDRVQAEAGLYESEEKLNLFIRHAPAALAMFDREMRYIAVSYRWLNDYGLTGSDVVGRSHYEVFPDITDEWRSTHQRALAGEILTNEEDQFTRADGSKQWLRWEVRPWHDKHGRIGGIVIFSEDITDRKLAAEALKKSESRFRLAFQKAPVAGALSRRTDGRITAVNERFTEIFGYTEAEVLGKTAIEIGLYDRTGRDRLRREFETHGRVRDFEISLPLKSGERRTMLVNFDVAEMPGVEYVLSTAIDITERKNAENSLRESEARLRMALDAAGIGVFDWDVPNNRITWSRWHEELWGLDQGEFDGTYEGFAKRIHYEDIERINAAIERCIAEQSRFAEEFRVVWPGGSTRWVTGLGDFEFDRDAKPMRMRGVVVETTDRKNVEQALSERAILASLTGDVALSLSRTTDLREMLRECTDALARNLNGALAGVWILDRANNVLMLQTNAGLESILDCELDHVPVGKSVIGSIAQSRQPYVTDLTKDKFDDFDLARAKGMVGFAGYPLLVEDRLVGVLSIFSKTFLPDWIGTALSSVADALAVGIQRKRSEILLESVVDNVIDGVISIDERGIIHSFNTSAQRMFGYDESEIVGANVSALMEEPYSGGHNGFISNYVRTGHAKIIGIGRQVEARRKDGTTFPIQLAINEFWVHGKRHFTGVVRDVTREQQLEGQLRQAQKMEAIGLLAGGIAHDFNNVLTVILGYSDLLQRTLDPGDPKRRSVEAIHEAGERAASLTNQLLAFSRKAVVQPREVDLNNAVQEAEKFLRRLIGENIDLHVRLDPDVQTTLIDPGQLGQVIVNLVLNSRDAMPMGGKVIIETFDANVDDSYCRLHPYAKLGRYSVLAVSDSGHGMTSEVKSRIFEPFFTTRGLGKGTGLGLATVYGIVKQSGGHVEVYSEVGKGSSFKVYLPVTDARGDTPEAGSAEPLIATGSETILVVEDEDMVRQLAVEMLESCGYRVLSAPDAGVAREIFDKHGEIDLLFTDVVMPGLSGTELANVLSTERPDLKVLFASGYTDDAVLRHGLIKSGSNYVQKPYSNQVLARKLREIFDRS